MAARHNKQVGFPRKIDWMPRWLAAAECLALATKPVRVKDVEAFMRKRKVLSKGNNNIGRRLVRALVDMDIATMLSDSRGTNPALFSAGPKIKQHARLLKKLDKELGLSIAQMNVGGASAWHAMIASWAQGGDYRAVFDETIAAAQAAADEKALGKVAQGELELETQEEPEPEAKPRRFRGKNKKKPGVERVKREPRASAESDDSIQHFLVNGRLPDGCVLMRKNGTWALGNPEDLAKITKGV